MKKILFFILSLLCLMTFAGCNGQELNQSYNYDNKQNAQQNDNANETAYQENDVSDDAYQENDVNDDVDVTYYCDNNSCDIRDIPHSHSFNGKCNSENRCCENCTYDYDCNCGCDNCYYEQQNVKRNRSGNRKNIKQNRGGNRKNIKQNRSGSQRHNYKRNHHNEHY